jgi:hypothetical protein
MHAMSPPNNAIGRSIGAVLSLSEGGCLLRTGERLRRGSKVDLQFALPEYGLVATKAECRYVRKGDAGISGGEGSCCAE